MTRGTSCVVLLYGIRSSPYSETRYHNFLDQSHGCLDIESMIEVAGIDQKPSCLPPLYFF